jgi:hypothetical protein
MADEMLRELAPLLAEEGINLDDPDGIDAPDMETLQAALNRAIERQNLARFTPVGPARDRAAATLRRAVTASPTVTPPGPPPPWTQHNRSRRTTRWPPWPAASGSHWGCSMTGSVATRQPPRPVWPEPSDSRPGTSTANAPPPTSSGWPANSEPSDP